MKTKIFLWALSLVEDYELGKSMGIKGWIADKLVFRNGEKV